MLRASLATAVLMVGLAVSGAAHAGSAGKCGGSGGDKTSTLTCPSGQYVAGISARAGAFLDEYGIACRKILVSGAAGALGDDKRGGPGGSGLRAEGKCAKGHAVNELWFRSGAVVDGAGRGFCVERAGDGWNSGDRDSTIDIREGGPGGLACSISCPAGEAIYKITIRYGGVIDSVRGECRR